MPKAKKVSRTRIHEPAVGLTRAEVKSKSSELQSRNTSAEIATDLTPALDSSNKGDHKTKAEKRREKKEKWMAMTSGAQDAKKKNKQKQKATPQFDPKLSDMTAALQSVVDMTDFTAPAMSQHDKVKQDIMNARQKTTTKKGRRHVMDEEISRFRNVLQHPSFKSDPLTTINQHVVNTVQQLNPS
ncbi:hypothetical protein BZG36_03961 [Bifiguratus adelaidae]|uniref:Ribosome biogenesis protein SLX9 n=1 Tax=Bifiguratus adelaidae TaxID=1938954 RepID=A0A261XZT5_9FUNG|nr:hypothetical protein BZG36_03961 [Bifiguratus adelaidae]